MPYTKDEIQTLIDRAAEEQNILPLSSRCDARCIFCSHHNNPPSVQVISIGTRTPEEVRETMGHLRADVPITIGESASSIIEGEPTLHPRFQELLAELRMRFPDTPVELTTNGRRLTEQLVAFLARHMPVMVNLSLNGGTPDSRRLLMGDGEEEARTAIDSVRLMERYGVPFQGSLVGMPNVTGWEDMERSIRCLADSGARTVRVFLPGFSKWVKKDVFPDSDTIYAELKNFLFQLSDDISCPVLLEPSFVSDLEAVLSGVKKGSPAWTAGLRKGDRLLSVNGQSPRSRTEAYEMVHRRRDVKVKYSRAGKAHTARWENGDEGSGVTMEFDFDLNRAGRAAELIAAAPGKVLCLCSEFGHRVFCAALDAAGAERGRFDAVPTPNLTFGGTIHASGLLCCGDYEAAFGAFCAEHPAPAGVLVPAESFNSLGKDLTGRHISELAGTFGVPVLMA